MLPDIRNRTTLKIRRLRQLFFIITVLKLSTGIILTAENHNTWRTASYSRATLSATNLSTWTGPESKRASVKAGRDQRLSHGMAFKLKQSTSLIKIQFVPHTDHRVAICEAARLMLHRDMKSKLPFQQNF